MKMDCWCSQCVMEREDELRVNMREIQVHLLRSRNAELVSRLAEVIEDRDAEKMNAEECKEIADEVTIGLAGALREPLGPCHAPCVGHLGSRANQAIKDAHEAWRGLEKERAEAIANGITAEHNYSVMAERVVELLSEQDALVTERDRFRSQRDEWRAQWTNDVKNLKPRLESASRELSLAKLSTAWHRVRLTGLCDIRFKDGELAIAKVVDE